MNIWLALGLKPDGFRSNLKRARDDVREFEQDWKSLGKVLSAGGLVYMVTNFFRSMTEHARQAKGELDENTAAVRRFGETLEENRNMANGWGVQVLGALNRVGESIGVLVKASERAKVALWDSLFKGDFSGAANAVKTAFRSVYEEERQLARTTKERAETEAAIAKANSKERAAAAAAAEKERQATQDRAKAQYELYRAKLSQKSVEEQLVAMRREEQQLAEYIQVSKAAGVDSTQAELDLLKLQAQIQEHITQLTKEQAAAAIAAAAAAKRARFEAQMQAEALRMGQKAYEAIMFGITNGGYDSQQIGEANDETLREILRRNNAQVTMLQQDPGSAFDWGNSLTLLRLRNENARIQEEIRLRERLRNDIGFLGVERARTQFKGDPIIFDRLVERFVSGLDQQGQGNDLLRQIRDRLTDRPDTQNLTDQTRRLTDAVLTVGRQLNPRGIPPGN
jgi:hypothetical protein